MHAEYIKIDTMNKFVHVQCMYLCCYKYYYHYHIENTAYLGIQFKGGSL